MSVEPVTAQQRSFRLVGLQKDTRQIVVGTQAALWLSGREQVVACLRLLSQDAWLLDALPSLRCDELVSTIGARGHLLRLTVSDSLILDRLARVAALQGGSVFIGQTPYFVVYRDARSPFGYDIQKWVQDPGDVCLFGHLASHPHRVVSSLSLSSLTTQLALLPLPGGALSALRALPAPHALWLLVAPGLVERVLRYLWQRQIPASRLLPDLSADAALLPSANHHLLSLQTEVSSTVLPLLSLPGVRLLLPQGTRTAVELGYAHPMHSLLLEHVLPIDRRSLFLAPGGPPLHVPNDEFLPPERSLSLVGVLPPSIVQDPPSTAPPLPPFSLSLTITDEATCDGPDTALFVPASRYWDLEPLLCLLPLETFSRLRAVLLQDGLLLIGEPVALPIGIPYYSPLSQVFLPRGKAIVPRVSAEQLMALLSAPADCVLVLLPSPEALGWEPDGKPSYRANRFLALPPRSLRPTVELIGKLSLEAPWEDPTPHVKSAPHVLYPSLGWLWPWLRGPKLAGPASGLEAHDAAKESTPHEGD